VIERDPVYTQASTTLSASNARIQFSLAENVRISQYTFEVLKSFGEDMAVEDRRPEIGFRQEGNLFMVDAAGSRSAREALALQRSLGCAVEWWAADEVRRRYPLYAADRFEGATFGSQDGHFDAYAALMGYKAKARALGAVYRHDEVTAIEVSRGRAEGVRLKSGGRLGGAFVINCAGAWCAEVARTAGVELPVKPIKRQIFVLDTRIKPDNPLPLTVLPSGLYFRTETGGTLLLGKSMPDDPEGYDFTWDDKRFTEILWPELADFAPAFDTLKLIRGWAGLYAVNTLDGNAILGPWPEISGLLLANGFSGHGLQQAPAVGRYMAELVTGAAHRLDLSIFSAERILSGRPINEKGLI
jgi:glycine/D-amino acid oxidase-like deaminating enzyme